MASNDNQNKNTKDRDYYLWLGHVSFDIQRGRNIDTYVQSTNPHVRQKVADKGYHLDVLIGDDDPYVRASVAKNFYGLDVLVNDDHDGVREAALILLDFVSKFDADEIYRVYCGMQALGFEDGIASQALISRYFNKDDFPFADAEFRSMSLLRCLLEKGRERALSEKNLSDVGIVADILDDANRRCKSTEHGGRQYDAYELD